MLRERIVEIDAQRRRDERTAETFAAVLAALDQVEHDISLRTSPRLRELQERGEALRLRMHRARATAERIVLNIAHWREAIQNDGGSQGNDGIEDEPPVQEDYLPDAIVRMNEMVAEFLVLRKATDRIGLDDDGSR